MIFGGWYVVPSNEGRGLKEFTYGIYRKILFLNWSLPVNKNNESSGA